MDLATSPTVTPQHISDLINYQGDALLLQANREGGLNRHVALPAFYQFGVYFYPAVAMAGLWGEDPIQWN